MNRDFPSGRIAIAWHGLPFYAYRCVESILEEFRPSLLATPGPASGAASKYAGFREIRGPNPMGWEDLQLPVPELFFQTGWGYPLFNHLSRQVRKSGGRVVAFVDNNRKNNLRQLLGALYYRVFLANRFAAVWVPGTSGRELMEFLGAERIYTGLYTAGPEFTAQGPEKRASRILYAGQFIERKAIQPLCAAFLSAMTDPWELWLVGSGPSVPLESKHIRVLPFQDPGQLANLMRESAWFVLPSYEEHWGVVVHEAALCGCALILRRSVGAARDLAGSDNALFFERDAELPEVLSRAMQIDPATVRKMGEASRRRAGAFSVDRWQRTFQEITRNLLPRSGPDFINSV
ncbi:MAG: glycosyltransferase [Spirochaetales bacterium]|nr:glycosyltransferase [Spirochaetales bacterium]